MFKEFWFDGNQGWGVIQNQAHINWLLERYSTDWSITIEEMTQKLKHARNARLESFEKKTQTPIRASFGFYSEHVNRPFLGEHLENQGFILQYDKSVTAAVPRGY